MYVLTFTGIHIHRYSHSQIFTFTTIQTMADCTTNTSDLSCIHCEKYFDTENDFDLHISETHPKKEKCYEWFCIYCDENFETTNDIDLHLAGGNSCSEIDTGRKNMKLVRFQVQDPENPNHYYVELINPAYYVELINPAAAADEPAAADEHVVSKSNDMFNKIKDLIMYGFCMRGTIEEYSRNTRNAYTQIKELLQDTKNTLSQKDVEELRHIYSFITNDVHGYYPSEDCHMFNMLRTATII